MLYFDIIRRYCCIDNILHESVNEKYDIEMKINIKKKKKKKKKTHNVYLVSIIDNKSI